MEPFNSLNVSAEGAQLSQTVAEIGEIALIERLRPFCAEGTIGDDAALIELPPDHRLVITTDMLSEGVHFSDRTTPPYAVGWRAVTANLSDLAAMGATPLSITVGLGLPGCTPWPWVEDLYRGMQACLSAYGGGIIGGDLCRAKQRTISITALGQVHPIQAIRRSSGSPGMTVVVTGPHGASRAGLALLLEELDLAETTLSRSQGQAKAWIQAHQRPVPRFDALECLRRLIQVDEGVSYPTVTGMDSSDGLANALLQISHSSRIGMEIVQAHIPLPLGLSAVLGDRKALEWALYGGEDFELVLCLPPNLARTFTATPFATAIGTTTDTDWVELVATAGSTERTRLTNKSFQHF